MVRGVDKGMSFTVREVDLQLKAISTKKTSGPDGTHPRSLKIGATLLAVPLHQLFMRSVPNICKQSNVIPIHKGPKPMKEVSYYKPIALTSVVIKALEKLVLSYMRSSIQCDRKQFHQNRSIQDALICLRDYIISHVDAKVANCCVSGHEHTLDSRNQKSNPRRSVATEYSGNSNSSENTLWLVQLLLYSSKQKQLETENFRI